MIAFIDRTDDLYRSASKTIDKLCRSNKDRFKIPIPVIGEAYFILSKKRDYSVKCDAFNRLENLFSENKFETIAFGGNKDAFEYAARLMRECDGMYKEDKLTPMDALIVADALIDPQCVRFYTSDNLLLMDRRLHDCVNEIRSEICSSNKSMEFVELKQNP